VVPAVVEKIDPIVNRGADDANAFLLVGLLAKVISAQTDRRDSFSGAAQRAVRNTSSDFSGNGGSLKTRQKRCCGSEFEEISSRQHRVFRVVWILRILPRGFRRVEQRFR